MMPPAQQHIVDTKLVVSIVGIVIGSILLLGILPFLLFGSFLYVRTVWRNMFEDRAQYLLDEQLRATWNAAARREARLRRNAEAIVCHWARKNGMVTRETPLQLAVLVCGQ
jgi:hypothetical protein